MTERLYTLHYFEPDPAEPQYCLHCDARPDDGTVHAQEDQDPPLTRRRAQWRDAKRRAYQRSASSSEKDA